MKENMIFGHRIPDTDSVCSAIALSELKNKINEKSKSYILGNINKETEFVLKYFDVEVPEKLINVRAQIKDLDYEKVEPFTENKSIHFAYFYMNEKKLRTLPIVDDEGNLKGIVTMKDIAMSLINTDQKHLSTSYDNIIETLIGTKVLKFDELIDGEITVASFEEKTLRKSDTLKASTIVIVGDRYDVINYAIEIGVKMIIITGDLEIPKHLLTLAIEKKVNIISTGFNTYYTAKNISLSKYVRDIMKNSGIVKFTEDDYLNDCKEDIQQSKHSKFPIVSKNNKYLGFLSRNNLINPQRKRVILVDHNEMEQSAEGIGEAEILEVIDHHKIGDIKTSVPINFRNNPVGSSNTIIYNMYKENGVEIDKKIAGIMLSGIVSDTLLFKSPTTTEKDKTAVKDLVNIVGIDLEKYAVEMFKAGTSLEGKTTEEIIFQDFKKFNLSDKHVGISQVFTLDINQIMNNKLEFINLIDEVTEDKDFFLVLMVVTDIIHEGSYFFYTGNKERVAKSIFGLDNVFQGIYLDKIVSRKKQIVPMVINALQELSR